MYCPSLHKEVVKGKFEAIVSDELFAKVQSMLGGNRFQALTNRINSAEFPLRQFVLCPFCGTPLTASKSTGSKNKKYAYYHCYNSSCKTKVRIPKNTLEKMFIEFLSTVKPNKECIETVKKSLKEQYSSMSKEFNKNHNDLSKKLTELKSTKDKLVDLYIQGKIDDTIYQSKLDSIKKEENEISITLNELKTPKANFNSCLDYVLNSLENLENLWLDNDLETKQKLQKLIFPSGLIYEETGFRTGSNPWFDIKKGALMAPIFYMVPPREFESLSTP
ncbi:MAG: recombinase zinc beta ribbon domain-containing protein [Candidatus Gastranaerophilales bacterium]|nr:recombinase zinc beta ribbon domain-containing protein [Candidatus Gastranaerophilales bacterium]